MADADTMPVIVGVGEAKDRLADPAGGWSRPPWPRRRCAARKRMQVPGCCTGWTAWTWHHALVLGREPASSVAVLRPFDRQADAVQRRGPAPPVVEDAAGRPGTLEAFTVPFRPDGTPDFGAVMLRLPGGARTLARVPAGDAGTLARLMSPDENPIGMDGTVSVAQDRLLEWRVGRPPCRAAALTGMLLSRGLAARGTGDGAG